MKEVLGGAAFLAFTAFYAKLTTQITVYDEGVLNARFFPIVLCVGLAILSLCLIAHGLRTMAQAKAAAGAATAGAASELSKQSGRAGWIRIGLTLGLLILYIAALRPIGFLIATTIFCWAQMLILAPREKWRIVRMLLLSVAFTVVVYLVFVEGFSLMLPKGLVNI